MVLRFARGRVGSRPIKFNKNPAQSGFFHFVFHFLLIPLIEFLIARPVPLASCHSAAFADVESITGFLVCSSVRLLKLASARM